MIYMWKNRDSHSFLEQWMRFGQVHDIKLEKTSLRKLHSKIKPLSCTFRVYIILQYEIKLIDAFL